jgi:hypothetical protein
MGKWLASENEQMCDCSKFANGWLQQMGKCVTAVNLQLVDCSKYVNV